MEFPIGFARTTYKRAKQFQEMLEELSCQLPLAIARLYLVTGEKFMSRLMNGKHCEKKVYKAR